jgi:hypothetical protein
MRGDAYLATPASALIMDGPGHLARAPPLTHPAIEAEEENRREPRTVLRDPSLPFIECSERVRFHPDKTRRSRTNQENMVCVPIYFAIN